jgi:RNA recognition motif-containing protein
MNIYVGNLSTEVTEDDIRKAFQAYGDVTKVSIIKDRVTGERRGFGFVEMPSSSAAQAAIDSLNRKDLKGKRIVVNEARPRAEKAGPGMPRSGDPSGLHGGGGGGAQGTGQTQVPGLDKVGEVRNRR